MARIQAGFSFDQRDLDLSQMYYNAWQAGLADNYYFSWNGTAYEDSYTVEWYAGGTYYGSVFGGYNMTVDWYDSVTGGAVTGYIETYYTGGQYVAYLSFEDISASALALWNAAQTFSTADDFAIFNAELAGADRFDLSNYADYANALGGNDTLYGNGGDDILLGGNGNDRLIGGTGLDQMYGQSGSDRFLFTKTNQTGTSSNNADIIWDFSIGYDKVDLSGIDAFAATGANDTFVFRGTGGFTSSTRGEVRFQKYDLSGTSADYTMIFIDTDGDTGPEAAILLWGLHNLTSTDFIL